MNARKKSSSRPAAAKKAVKRPAKALAKVSGRSAGKRISARDAELDAEAMTHFISRPFLSPNGKREISTRRIIAAIKAVKSAGFCVERYGIEGGWILKSSKESSMQNRPEVDLLFGAVLKLHLECVGAGDCETCDAMDRVAHGSVQRHFASFLAVSCCIAISSFISGAPAGISDRRCEISRALRAHSQFSRRTCSRAMWK